MLESFIETILFDKEIKSECNSNFFLFFVFLLSKKMLCEVSAEPSSLDLCRTAANVAP